MYYHNLNVIRKGSKKLLTTQNSKTKNMFNTRYISESLFICPLINALFVRIVSLRRV